LALPAFSVSVKRLGSSIGSSLGFAPLKIFATYSDAPSKRSARFGPYVTSAPGNVKPDRHQRFLDLEMIGKLDAVHAHPERLQGRFDATQKLGLAGVPVP
jgi:hypothetical protein